MTQIAACPNDALGQQQVDETKTPEEYPSKAPASETRQQLADRGFLDPDDDDPPDTPGGTGGRAAVLAFVDGISRLTRPSQDRVADEIARLTAQVARLCETMTPPYGVRVLAPTIGQRMRGIAWHVAKVMIGLLALYGGNDMLAAYGVSQPSAHYVTIVTGHMASLW